MYLLPLIICIIAACKKETTETNDPNIDDRLLNFSLDGSAAANNNTIDFDNDGSNDFNVYVSHPNATLSNSEVGANGMSSVEFSTETSGIVTDLAKTYAKDATINSASGTWKSITRFYYFDAGTSPTKFGFSDVGDKYVGFRVADGSDYYYGWLSVHIADGNKVTLKAFGLMTIANTAIKAGAK